MTHFLLKRLSSLLMTFFGVSVLAFSLIRLVPGDPVKLLLGERGVAPEVYIQLRHNLGLDQSLMHQYFLYVKNILHGDLGFSIISKGPVLQEFFERFPATLELGLCAFLFSLIFGIPFGIIAAAKRNKFPDYTLMGGALIGYSMPIFWWGLILILIFSVQLGLTPVSGRISVMYDITSVTGFMLIDSLLSPYGFAAFKNAASHLLLPSIAMGTIPLAAIARMTRSSMLEVLGEDYIRTANAKGLTRFRVVCFHAFKNALLPIITVAGLLFGSIITGAILTETIFSWPGIGKWMVASVQARDYPVIQGGIFLIATMIIIINMLVDLSYALVNPKLRSSSK